MKWKIENNFATSEQLPGVRIPGAPFMGVSGVAPSKDKLKEWTKRENEAMATGKVVFPPDAGGAIPSTGTTATEDCEPFHLANAAEISM